MRQLIEVEHQRTAEIVRRAIPAAATFLPSLQAIRGGGLMVAATSGGATLVNGPLDADGGLATTNGAFWDPDNDVPGEVDVAP